MDAGAMERLVGVDVADAGHDSLIEEKSLHRSAPPAKRRTERRPVEAVVQRLGSETGVQVVHGLAIGEEIQRAEATDVGEDQATAVRQSEDGPRMDRRVVGDREPVTGHAQVRYEGLRPVETEEQVLAPTIERAYRPLAQTTLDDVGFGRADQTRVEDRSRANTSPLEEREQAAAYGFDFGQFGHGPTVARPGLRGARARVRGQEGLAQVGTRDVRVDRRGRDARVTEEFLHGPEIAATLDEMSCERVPERMRPDPVREPGRLGVSSHDEEDPPPSQARTPVVDDQRPGILPSPEERTTARLVALNRRDRLCAARDDAFASPLARHTNQTQIAIEIGRSEPGQFGDPESRAVEEFEHGTVAETERSAVRVLDERDRLLGGQRTGRRLWRTGQGNVSDPGLTRALARAVPKERPRRGHPTPHGRRGEAATAEGDRERLEFGAANRVEIETGRAQVLLELAQIVAVGRDRMR